MPHEVCEDRGARPDGVRSKDWRGANGFLSMHVFPGRLSGIQGLLSDAAGGVAAKRGGEVEHVSMTAPGIGGLVRGRGQHWVVADVHGPDRAVEDGQTLVELLSVSDGGYGDELQVIWEVEPGREV